MLFDVFEKYVHSGFQINAHAVIRILSLFIHINLCHFLYFLCRYNMKQWRNPFQNEFGDMMFRKVHTENMCRQVVKSSSFTQMHSANRMAVLHTILMWNNIYLPYTLLLTPKMSTTKRCSFITFQYHKHR